MEIQDLREDLKDGLLLIHLLEILGKDPVKGKYNRVSSPTRKLFKTRTQKQDSRKQRNHKQEEQKPARWTPVPCELMPPGLCPPDAGLHVDLPQEGGAVPALLSSLCPPFTNEPRPPFSYALAEPEVCVRPHEVSAHPAGEHRRGGHRGGKREDHPRTLLDAHHLLPGDDTMVTFPVNITPQIGDA
jgi:hypothetical protein